MNIRLFCDSIHEQVQNFNTGHKSTIGEAIFSDYAHLPRWKDIDIAIIGIGACADALLAIRKAFYGLSPGRDTYRLADLGNVRQGANTEENIYRLGEVCAFLFRHGVLPVIIADQPSLCFGQYIAYEHQERVVYPVLANRTIDLSEQALLSRILRHHPNYLFSMAVLGFQHYLCNPEHLLLLQKMGFDAMSIGQMRHDIRETEPMLRQADMLLFDMGAIRSTEAPGNGNPMPFGFTAEEACQVAWYAGNCPYLSSMSISGISTEPSEAICSIAAVMMWYFVEGFYLRKDTKQPLANYTRYNVAVTPDAFIVFYKGRTDDRWWMEVPVPPEDISLYGRQWLVPCSDSDYDMASKGIVPDRWIKAQQRF